MRLIPHIAAAALLVTAAFPAAALAGTGSREVNSWGDFSIKPSDIPNGCQLLVHHADEVSAEITCPDQQAFETGFTISSDFTTACDTKNGKYVCIVKKR